MSWNYRVLATKTNDGIYLDVCEVYYNKKGEANGYIEHKSISGESIEDIKFTLDKMNEALKKPILWGGSDFPKEYKTEQQF